MRRFLLLILTLSILFAPMALVLSSDHSILETPRMNLQRASIASSLFIYPGETQEYFFKASEDGLSKVSFFMRPAPLASLRDRYSVIMEDITIHYEYGPFEFSPLDLWDDVASMPIEMEEISADHEYKLTIQSAESNTSPLQLGLSVHDMDDLILETYYSSDTSYGDALLIVWERLSWRLWPLLLLIPMMVIFWDKMLKLYRR